MSDKKKKKVNGKKKGNNFEREVYKDICAFTGLTFRKTFGSGAFHTAYSKGHELGDVRPEDPEDFYKFPYIVECKSYSSIPWQNIIKGSCSQLDEWLNQAIGYSESFREQTGEWFSPIVIFKANRTPKFFAYYLDIEEQPLKEMKIIHSRYVPSEGMWNGCYYNNWVIEEFELDKFSSFYKRDMEWLETLDLIPDLESTK